MIEFKQIFSSIKFQSYNFKKYDKFYLLNTFAICYNKVCRIVSWNGEEVYDDDDDEEELMAKDEICRFNCGMISKGGRLLEIDDEADEADDGLVGEFGKLPFKTNLQLLTSMIYLTLLTTKCEYKYKGTMLYLLTNIAINF